MQAEAASRGALMRRTASEAAKASVIMPCCLDSATGGPLFIVHAGGLTFADVVGKYILGQHAALIGYREHASTNAAV